MTIIESLNDPHADAAPAINAALRIPGKVELGPAVHSTFQPIGIESTEDLSAAVTFTGQNIRGTKVISNLRDPDTNKQGQHPILKFTTTKGNLRFLQLQDMSIHHGNYGLFTDRLLYSRMERVEFMQTWEWGVYLYRSSMVMDGVQFVHNYGNSLYVAGGHMGSHLVNSMIGEDSGSVYVNGGGLLRISGCLLYRMRDKLNPGGLYPGYGNSAFFVGASSTLTVDGNHFVGPSGACENIFLLNQTAGLNVVNNPVFHVENRTLLRLRYINNGEWPFGPITITGNTFYFGHDGLIAKANTAATAPRNLSFCDNVLYVPEGSRAVYEAQLQALRDIPAKTHRNGIIHQPNRVEGNRIYEYVWSAPLPDDEPGGI